MFAAGTSLWDSRRYEPRLMGLQGQSEIFFCEKGQNPKTTQRWSMQYVSRSGRPYPNIVHNVQSPALKQTRPPYIKISRICRHSRQSVVSNPSACQMVESRILYVGIRESGRMLHISFIIIFHIPFLPLIYLLMLRY